MLKHITQQAGIVISRSVAYKSTYLLKAKCHITRSHYFNSDQCLVSEGIVPKNHRLHTKKGQTNNPLNVTVAGN